MKGVLKVPHKFYITFGYGQLNAGCVLPIVATSEHEARAYVAENYYNNYCTSYTEERWNAWKEKNATSSIPLERELPTIDLTVKEVK